MNINKKQEETVRPQDYNIIHTYSQFQGEHKKWKWHYDQQARPYLKRPGKGI